MKVLFVGPSLGTGGAERQTSILVPGLRSRGIDARLIALEGSGFFEEPLRRKGVPLEVIGMRHRADVGRLLRSELVRGFVPDAVISRGGVSGLYVGYALARWRRAVHIYNDHRGAGLANTLRREAMTRLIASRIDYVVGVSADQAPAWNVRGYPAERFRVVQNGVDAPLIAESRLAIRQELAISEAAVVALLVARLAPEKQVPIFVRAVLRARKTHPELIGLVAGEGPERLAVHAASMGDPAIRLLGNRDDVPRLLKAADVFVLASSPRGGSDVDPRGDGSRPPDSRHARRGHPRGDRARGEWPARRSRRRGRDGGRPGDPGRRSGPSREHGGPERPTPWRTMDRRVHGRDLRAAARGVLLARHFGHRAVQQRVEIGAGRHEQEVVNVAARHALAGRRTPQERKLIALEIESSADPSPPLCGARLAPQPSENDAIGVPVCPVAGHS